MKTARSIGGWSCGLAIALGCRTPGDSAPIRGQAGPQHSVVLDAVRRHESAENSPEVLLLGLEEDLASPGELSEQEVTEDVTSLQIALQHGWGARKIVDPALVSKALAELKNLRSVGRAWTSTELCTAIGEILASIPDAHFSVAFEQRSPCFRESQREPSVGANIVARPFGVVAYESSVPNTPLR